MNRAWLKFGAAAVIAIWSIMPAQAKYRPVEVWFEMPIEEVSEVIANICGDRNAMVIQQDLGQVVCAKPMTGFKGALTQLAIGNSYSTRPERKLRFAIFRQGDAVRVLAEEWLETQMALGQVRREPVTSEKNMAHIRGLLVSQGGLLERPARRMQSAIAPARDVGAEVAAAAAPALPPRAVSTTPPVAPDAAGRRRNPDFGTSNVRCTTCRE